MVAQLKDGKFFLLCSTNKKVIFGSCYVPFISRLCMDLIYSLIYRQIWCKI